MRTFVFFLPLLLTAPLGGCTHKPAPAPAPAAEKPRVEAELARTTISRQARESLGVRTTAVRVEAVQESRPLSGWVLVPPGAEVTVTAPVGGYVQEPETGRAPAPGLPIKAGQELFRLEPVLSPLEQTQLAALRRGIESDLAKARENLALAENELKRVQTLFGQKLRGERDVEQARTAFKIAQEDLGAAEDKLKVIAFPGADKHAAKPAPLRLSAPRKGVALAVPASPGQFVAAAAPLVTIADLSEPWVRVPVPEHDLARVDPGPVAAVTVLPEGLTGRAAAAAAGPPVRLFGKHVARVPQVDPVKHTAELIYKLEAADGAKVPDTLVKDQMVLVDVPLRGSEAEAIVPYSAVLFDAYGGSWVYLDRTPKDAETCSYERVRVELGAAVGKKDVVVRPALRAGDAVVSDGAAALFSREFYRPPVVVPETAKGKS